jgi:ABC-type dipeptide/oligopeptide/nickel transport system ATPase component
VAPTPSGEPLVSVRNLKKYFPITQGILFQKTVGNVHAVDDVSFDVMPGETLGLVGESGSGKSTVARVIMKLLEATSGQILYNGEDVTRFKSRQMRPFRREMQMIFQDPYASLNPRQTVGQIIGSPFKVHKTEGDIKKKILTAASSKLPFTKDKYFDPNVWRTDVKRIERYYQERGFFQAKVVEEKVEPKADGVEITVKVDEGEPTRLAKFEVQGLDKLTKDQREQVLDDLPLTEGMIFEEERWEGLKALLVERLQELVWDEFEFVKVSDFAYTRTYRLLNDNAYRGGFTIDERKL